MEPPEPDNADMPDDTTDAIELKRPFDAVWAVAPGKPEPGIEIPPTET